MLFGWQDPVRPKRPSLALALAGLAGFAASPLVAANFRNPRVGSGALGRARTRNLSYRVLTRDLIESTRRCNGIHRRSLALPHSVAWYDSSM